MERYGGGQPEDEVDQRRRPRRGRQTLLPGRERGGGAKGANKLSRPDEPDPPRKTCTQYKKVGENHNYVLPTECMIQCEAAE